MNTETVLNPVANNSLSTEHKIVINPRNKWLLALRDIITGWRCWRIWTLLAYQDIRLRYRRSTLGPFWLTLSMAITVYSMGFLYSRLFHVDLQYYFPFLTAGMLAWSLINTIISELTEGFVSAEGLLKQIKLPYTLFIHRAVYRNLLIFFHNVVVLIPVLLIFHHSAKVDWYSLLILPALIIIYILGIIYGMLLALICARFRDIAQIVKSLLQVIFFMTPVMWTPPAKYQIIAALNPFYACVDIIRAPLMGKLPEMDSLLMLGFILSLGIFLYILIFPKYRSRIIYWL